MAAKPDASPAPAAAAATPPPAAAPAKGGLAAWLPLILALVLAPAVTWAAVEFVLVPRLQKKLAAPPSEPDAAVAHEAPAAKGEKGKEGKGGSAPGYAFENVVVNLAGTMGTRYLKTTFLVTGAGSAVQSAFEAEKPRLMDVTLNVLSSLTLADLEEPGAKNVIREKLVAAYNQALGRKVAEQVYFSDFVVQ
jgi:flagellar protein FliL